MTARQRIAAFTIVDLLTAVSIIAILAAIMVPGIRGMRAEARTTICAFNLSQIGIAFGTFHEGKHQSPAPIKRITASAWPDSLLEYVGGNSKTYVCPESVSNQSNMSAPAYAKVLKRGYPVVDIAPFSEASSLCQRVDKGPNHYILKFDSGSVLDWDDFVFDVKEDPIKDETTMTCIRYDSPLHLYFDVIAGNGSVLMHLEWGDAEGKSIKFKGRIVSSSYAMNSTVKHLRGSNKVLMLEYNKHVAYLSGNSFLDNWHTNVAPRHRGNLHVMGMDLGVQRETPDELNPIDPMINLERWTRNSH